MRPTLRVAIMLTRLLGVVQIVLGIVLWIGVARSTVPLHAALGSLLVLAIWIIAVIALFALPQRGLALFTLVWGAIVLWLGMAQTRLVVGSGHWVIRVAHLVIGLAALGLAESLASATRRHWDALHPKT
jgi:hypothetical protein